ncbi:tRNA lysidine(34) synthetase TilS [Alteripontixanthobacter maritimus]
MSGGPDSMALLLLTAAAFPQNLSALSVDHRLRPESAQECALVADLCAALGIPHATLAVDVAPGNLQANARSARYAAMAQWMAEKGLRDLATAHHADDQAETLLMRLNRGSGVAGLAGIRRASLREDGLPVGAMRVVRPLLGWRKSELGVLCESAGIETAHDPSNRDAAYDRVRLREALGQAAWLDPAALAISARHLGEADEALEWATTQEWDAQVVAGENALSYRPAAPRAVRMRVLARAVAHLAGADRATPRGGELAQFLDRLESGEGGNIGGVLIKVADGVWTMGAEPQRRV